MCFKIICVMSEGTRLPTAHAGLHSRNQAQLKELQKMKALTQKLML